MTTITTTSTVNLGKVPTHPLDIHKIPLKEGVPKPPVLGIFVGKRGQGKTVTATRLLHYYTHNNPEVFQKELVFVISPTAESQTHLWDHIGCDPENVFPASTQTEIKNIIDAIIEILKSKKKKYDEDQEYIEAYNVLMRDGKLTARQEFILDQRDCQPLVNPEPWPRPCLLLDDLSHMKVMDKAWFISLCLRHRHVAGGVSLSILMLVQSLRGGVARVIRQNCSLIILYSTHDQTAKDDLYAECSHLLDKEEFMALFEHATDERHDFMSVDLSQDDKNRVFSRSFEHWYQISNSIDQHVGLPVLQDRDRRHHDGEGSVYPPQSTRRRKMSRKSAR
jgi:hypothetical protein